MTCAHCGDWTVKRGQRCNNGLLNKHKAALFFFGGHAGVNPGGPAGDGLRKIIFRTHMHTMAMIVNK